MDPKISEPNACPLPEAVGGNSQIVELLLREKIINDKQVDYAARVLSKIDTPRPMLEVLKELNFIDDDRIKDTVRESRVPMCIGNLLVELGYIPFEDVQRALKIQSEDINHRKLGEILLDRRLIDEHALIEVLSLQMGFPLLDPEFSEIDPELFSRVNSRWYEKYDVIPIHKGDGGIVIAFTDPLDRNDLEAVKQVFGDRFIPGIARKSSIKRAVRRCLTGLAHEAFFAGLLHDVGKLFILTVIDDLKHSDDLDIQPSDALLLEAMNSLHANHGYSLMVHWNLPEKYSNIVRDHHNEEFDSKDMLQNLVRLADKACLKQGIGMVEDRALVLVATAEAESLHISEVDLAQMEIMLEDSQVFEAGG